MAFMVCQVLVVVGLRAIELQGCARLEPPGRKIEALAATARR